MSLRIVPTVLPIAMASPAPLPPLADTDSSGMSVTGLLSPNPAVNLTAELSEVMKDDNSFWDDLENEFLDKPSPDRNQGQQNLTTALANQGTTVINNNTHIIEIAKCKGYNQKQKVVNKNGKKNKNCNLQICRL